MTKDLYTFAQKFVQDQFAIMKKYGEEPKLDSQRYEAAVRETQRTFKGMRAVRLKRQKT
jgi:hypothetical protein